MKANGLSNRGMERGNNIMGMNLSMKDIGWKIKEVAKEELFILLGNHM
jgi:hypothetical protein